MPVARLLNKFRKNPDKLCTKYKEKYLVQARRPIHVGFFSLACAGYNLIKSISKKQFQSAVYIYF